MAALTLIKDSYFGVNAAVLGASGFIGRWVAHHLCARGARVALIVRNTGPADDIFSMFGIRGRVIESDLRHEQSVRDILSELRPSVTFNLVGYGIDPSERDERSAYETNAEIVRRLRDILALVRDPDWAGQDLVHVGSALEYGDAGGDLAEDSVCRPTTVYGKAKLAGTRYLAHRACGLKATTARLFTVYGPGEHPGRLLPSLMAAAASQDSLDLTDGCQKRDFTYVEDVAEGLLRLGLSAARPGEIVNLATGTLTSVRRFAESAGRILGIPDDRLRFGAIPARAEEMEHSGVSVGRCRSLLGWVPSTGIEEGIRKTLSFSSPVRTCSWL